MTQHLSQTWTFLTLGLQVASIVAISIIDNSICKYITWFCYILEPTIQTPFTIMGYNIIKNSISDKNIVGNNIFFRPEKVMLKT